MAVKRAIHLKGGGTLLLHYDGKKTYIPSIRYKEQREKYLKPMQRRGKPETEQNCFKLLCAIFGHPIEEQKNPFRTTYLPAEASARVRIWKD